MNNSIFEISKPLNEPILSYKKGSEERDLLDIQLDNMYNEEIEIPLIIGGKEIRTGNITKIVMPTENGHILATYHKAGKKETQMAIDASLKAKKEWEDLSWLDRASIMMKAAELISVKYRYILNSATMLGQGKNSYQAEIDASCELADFLRFNSYYISKIYNNQPSSPKGIINRIEYRALEGFIFAITPFNFTAIAGNLTSAPALMGNTVVWKPSHTAIFSGYYLMKLFKEAGLPDGVINFVPGGRKEVGEIALNHEMLAGIHFTGSTNSFNNIWGSVANNIGKYFSYPRLVGETGGKDFIFTHNSADPKEVSTALIRGAFEYQGQKCSAASRAYIPKSIWSSVQKEMILTMNKIKTGDVRDYSNFYNAVIDEGSFDNIGRYMRIVRDSSNAEIIMGGKGDKSVGYFYEPTVVLTTDPKSITMQEEIFGPVLTIFLYEDDKFEETLNLCDKTSVYALTGSILARDRNVINTASQILRNAAGNFYINDKPSGAVVDQQPFGGARKSGTNDKAGSSLNLMRWVSARTIKENLVPQITDDYLELE